MMRDSRASSPPPPPSKVTRDCHKSPLCLFVMPGLRGSPARRPLYPAPRSPRQGIRLSCRAHRKLRTMNFIAIRNGATRRRVWLISAMMLISTAGSARAAGLQQIVRARQDHFKTLGRTVKSLRGQMRRSHPDWAVVTNDTHQIESLASALPNWFPAGSGKGHGVRTKARSAIWTNPRVFTQAAQTLLTRAQGLTQAADSRDLRALALRTRGLGQACGSCHRRFRAHRSWW